MYLETDSVSTNFSFSFVSPFVSRRRSPNGSQRRFSRCVMRKNDNVEDSLSRVEPRWASGPAKSGSDRGQFVDVIDENASCAGAVSESVEWSSGRPVVIFNFSIKAQVGRLMVAICSFGVSAVDLTSDGLARSRQHAHITRRGFRKAWLRARRQILFGAAAKSISGTNIKIGRQTLRWCGTRALAAPSRRWHTGRNRFDNLEVGPAGPRAAAHYL